ESERLAQEVRLLLGIARLVVLEHGRVAEADAGATEGVRIARLREDRLEGRDRIRDVTLEDLAVRDPELGAVAHFLALRVLDEEVALLRLGRVLLLLEVGSD